ncbi:hydantoinase/oxoprolinase protein [Ostertagia ostertagi]
MTGFGFAIDRGGTFTDVCVFRPDGTTRVLKVLSEDPANYADAPTEAIRQVLEQETGVPIPRGSPVPADNISWIRMGTTVATNALLERKGERIALLITKGFKDLLYIGNQTRPRIFDFDIKIPGVLYEEVVEVDERVIPSDDSCELGNIGRVEETFFGKKVIVEKEPNEDEVRALLKAIMSHGIKSVAVAFLHSFIYPAHELKVKEIAHELGLRNVSLSHEVMPMIKIVPRGFTGNTSTDLSLASLMGLDSVRVDFMQSDGGLCSVKKFSPVSGASKNTNGRPATVGLTSKPHSWTSIPLQLADRDQGCSSTTGIFVVGPESVGAHPGPVCYRKGGSLAITDANLVLGRIMPEFFPKIFGQTQISLWIGFEATYSAMKELTEQINEHIKRNPDAIQKEYSVEEAALGFVKVANEEMCRPIRAITQARGYDTSAHILACFGGAGGQHACAVAQDLGISTVLIHKYASLLSAYGIALARVVSEVQEPVNLVFSPETTPLFAERLTALSEKATNDLKEQGFREVHCEHFLHMRFAKTDCAIMISAEYNSQNPKTLNNFVKTFYVNYKREFGFVLEDRDIIVDDIRVRGVASSGIKCKEHIAMTSDPDSAVPMAHTRTFFEVKCNFPV